MIEITNLNKKYKSGKSEINALKNINLRISENEFIAIIGPSGSGKSTLMQMIGGMDLPTSGDVKIDSTIVSKMNDIQLSEFRNKEVGFIFQLFFLQMYLTVFENIQIPLFFRNISVSERHAKAMAAAESVGLKDKINSLPKELSGGQMQRVAIARAIAGDPKIILADEPTANVDRENSNNIMELFRKIHTENKSTIIIVTHDELVARYCDRVIKLEDGKIISDYKK